MDQSKPQLVLTQFERRIMVAAAFFKVRGQTKFTSYDLVKEMKLIGCDDESFGDSLKQLVSKGMLERQETDRLSIYWLTEEALERISEGLPAAIDEPVKNYTPFKLLRLIVEIIAMFIWQYSLRMVRAIIRMLTGRPKQ